MANVTYLLGAGASADCLPTVEKFEDKVEKFKNTIKGSITAHHILKDGFKFDEELTQFTKLVSRNPTVDILAKKFYHKGLRTDLINLKKWLTIFFFYMQYTYHPDDRYDKFLAAIVGNEFAKIKLPDNLKIITWNYDMQFEIAMADYLKDEISMELLHSTLNVYPRVSSRPLDQEGLKGFQIVRLNGTAGIYPLIKNEGFQTSFELQNTNYVRKVSSGELSKEILESIKIEFDHKYRTGTTYTYAWEVEPSSNQAKFHAQQIALDTEVLVVIGYSFPYVNREIDDQIFRKLIKLRRIYIQNHVPISDERLNFIKSRITKGIPGRKSDSIEIELIINPYEFYLPPEL